MDSLENRLLEGMLVDFSDSIVSDERRANVLNELAKPIDQIDQATGVKWAQRVPASIAASWNDLPMSTRLLVWDLCRQIQSLEEVADENYRLRFET